MDNEASCQDSARETRGVMLGVDGGVTTGSYKKENERIGSSQSGLHCAGSTNFRVLLRLSKFELARGARNIVNDVRLVVKLGQCVRSGGAIARRIEYQIDI